MKNAINLVRRLLVKGRKLRKLGVSEQALELFRRLAQFRRLPESVARETRRHLAHLYCERRQYRRARRLLAPRLLTDPHEPRWHYLLGRLAAQDVRCEPRQALWHFRRCLKLEPDNPRYLSAFGIFALNNGREKLGLRLLQRAYRLAPASPKVVRRYLKALKKLHRLGEARRLMQMCRFRLSHETWFQNLLAEFQFFMLHVQQRRSRRQRVASTEPRLLPFVRVRQQLDRGATVEPIRHDGPAILPAPHLPLPQRRPNQRHAR
jgi:predicted Zn-dependent protease